MYIFFRVTYSAHLFEGWRRRISTSKIHHCSRQLRTESANQNRLLHKVQCHYHHNHNSCRESQISVLPDHVLGGLPVDLLLQPPQKLPNLTTLVLLSSKHCCTARSDPRSDPKGVLLCVFSNQSALQGALDFNRKSLQEIYNEKIPIKPLQKNIHNTI